MGDVEGLRSDLAGGVLEVVIDRGDDNIFSLAMCEHLGALLTRPPEGAHVLRLRAEGPAFCLGRERSGETVADLRVETATIIGLNQALSRSPLVTVAEVAGDAAGYGAGLAALCDVSIAAPSAQFYFPEVTIDLAPTVVLTWLSRMVGRKQAFLLAATGDRVDARRAAELGLLTEVSATDEELPEHVSARIEGLQRWSPRVHAQISEFLLAIEDLTETQAYGLAAERLVTGSLERRRDVPHP
jgi:enoyl-CoA hydratase/carnithine racemase